MSYPTHLIKVKNRFYYKIKVPADLDHLFHCQFIKESLQTNELSAAKTMLRYHEFKTHNAFALLRTGTLAEDHIKHVVQSLIPVPKAYKSDKQSLLSKVIVIYTEEKQAGWSEKTRPEVAGAFKLLVDIIGDADVTKTHAYRAKIILAEGATELLRQEPWQVCKCHHR